MRTNFDIVKRLFSKKLIRLFSNRNDEVAQRCALPLDRVAARLRHALITR
jgi:hypothetical protein